MFGFVEKLIRRTFVHLSVDKGKTEKDAIKDSKKSNLMALNGKWRRATGQSLQDVIGRDAWAQIFNAAELRNELIHGGGHRDERIYKETIDGLLGIIDGLRAVFLSNYGYSGWRTPRGR
ncbi:MAG: hypothetical protein ACYC35_08355 [Pirellulales bacterium]